MTFLLCEPRPDLEYDVANIVKRFSLELDHITPGLWGWAEVRGRNATNPRTQIARDLITDELRYRLREIRDAHPGARLILDINADRTGAIAIVVPDDESGATR